MIRFYLLRSLKDWVGHLILISIPIVLISFFYYIIRQDIQGTEAEAHLSSIVLFLSIGFALTFQIYGTAISYETLDSEFLTPMRDRLLATPVIPVKIVFAILLSGIIVSFLQTLVVLIFATVIYGAIIPKFPLVLLIMLLSIVFHQLMASVILLWAKKSKTAGAITTLYAIVAPMLLGLYFGMPDYLIFRLLEKYLMPISLANTAVMGLINSELRDVLIGVTILVGLSSGMLLLVKPLTRRALAS